MQSSPPNDCWKDDFGSETADCGNDDHVAFAAMTTMMATFLTTTQAHTYTYNHGRFTVANHCCKDVMMPVETAILKEQKYNIVTFW